MTSLDELRREVAARNANRMAFEKMNMERKELQKELKALNNPKLTALKRISKQGLTVGGRSLLRGSKVLLKGLGRIADNVAEAQRIENRRQRRVRVIKRKPIKRKTVRRKTTKRKRRR